MVKNAFTLIELLVVLVIISLIMLVVVPQGSKLYEMTNKKFEEKDKYLKLKEKRYESFLKHKKNHIFDFDINEYGIIIKNEEQ